MKIIHTNPNCIDSERCNPHGETGEVTYKMKDYKAEIIKRIEMHNIRLRLVSSKEMYDQNNNILMENILPLFREIVKEAVGEMDYRNGKPEPNGMTDCVCGYGHDDCVCAENKVRSEILSNVEEMIK